MQAPNHAAPGDFSDDVLQTVVGLAGRGRVVKRQQDPGEYLRHEKEEGNAAENLVPAAGRRDVFIKKALDSSLYAGTMFQPVNHFSCHTFSGFCRSPMRSLVPSIRTWNRSRGRGAGPLNTFPSMSNVEVWHGQRKFLLLSSQW